MRHILIHQNGYTALMWAAHDDHAEMVTQLLDRGAIIDGADKVGAFSVSKYRCIRKRSYFLLHAWRDLWLHDCIQIHPRSTTVSVSVTNNVTYFHLAGRLHGTYAGCTSWTSWDGDAAPSQWGKHRPRWQGRCIVVCEECVVENMLERGDKRRGEV